MSTAKKVVTFAPTLQNPSFIKPFEEIGMKDVSLVGGKNASLGEMIQHLSKKGVRVPTGFAITADAYRSFIEFNNLESKIQQLLKQLKLPGKENLQQVGEAIRHEIQHKTQFPPELHYAITSAYKKLGQLYSKHSTQSSSSLNSHSINNNNINNHHHHDTSSSNFDLDVAVRSSATAEDLPDASFAGQQDTYLNIRGEDQLLLACKCVYASLYTDRAISYRIDKGYDKCNVALSIGVQKMVRSDLATSGVTFTLDTESGLRDVVFITGSYGLGENVVQGIVVPDEFYVHKETFKQGYAPVLKKRLGTKTHKLVYKKHTASVQSTMSSSCELLQNNTTTSVPVSLKDQGKYCLTDEQILDLTRQALIIEEHYSQLKGSNCPMDIEWAQDYYDGKIYIVQARPETVHSMKKQQSTSVYYEEYSLQLTNNSGDDKKKNKNKTNKNSQSSSATTPLLNGKSVGRKIVTGEARICYTLEQMKQAFAQQATSGSNKSAPNGENNIILVTDHTDPNMEPYMSLCSGIITQTGGRTCHAAIVSRELGIPCIVGAEGACSILKNGQQITMDCTNEVGHIYNGKLEFKVQRTELSSLPKLPVHVMMNVANPDECFNVCQIPNKGVGLARLEFVINNTIRVHPMALVHPERVTDEADKQLIADILHSQPGLLSPEQYFINRLAEEAGTIAAAFYPNPVIFRMSDFKSNEYFNLIGGKYFEPSEENPMIGFRGASRYYHENYREGFALECKAMKRMRDEMGLVNAKLMIPFVRTVQEAKQVIEEMKYHGLIQGKNGLELYMMVEIPSNVILIEQFAQLFDGFSIGSNDLTQLTLGVDRDSHLVMPLFDERNEAVKIMLELAIKGAKKHGKKIGICGQCVSDFPDMAKFLMDLGIDSMSLIPDTVIKTTIALAASAPPRSSAA